MHEGDAGWTMADQIGTGGLAQSSIVSERLLAVLNKLKFKAMHTCKITEQAV